MSFKAEQRMIQEWIVNDLTDLLPELNDNRYDIFKHPEKLGVIADNIKLLLRNYTP